MSAYLGYWKRGKSQYWHITDKGALLINSPEKNTHYDGDAHIFFNPSDSTLNNHSGRVAITKQEFESAKKRHINRIKQF